VDPRTSRSCQTAFEGVQGYRNRHLLPANIRTDVGLKEDLFQFVGSSGHGRASLSATKDFNEAFAVTSRNCHGGSTSSAWDARKNWGRQRGHAGVT